MLRVMDALTDKPEWDKKVFNDDIVDKWRREALTMPLMSERAFEWYVILDLYTTLAVQSTSCKAIPRTIGRRLYVRRRFDSQHETPSEISYKCCDVCSDAI